MVTEILVRDAIFDDLWGGVNQRMVAARLREAGDDGEVLVRINSPGGIALEGVAIYTALSRHKGKVVVEIEGVAASAASVVMLAGDEIRISQGAMIMVHEAHAYAMGDASRMEAVAEMLRKTTAEISALYVARTGQTAETVAAMLKKETWMGAAEALELGFVDAVIPAKAKPAPATELTARAMASFRHVPDQLRAPGAQAPAAACARAPIQTPMSMLSRRA